MDKNKEVKSFKEAKDKVRGDHKKMVEYYQLYLSELQNIEKLLFQLKVAIGGLITTVFVFLFSDIKDIASYSIIFKISFLTLLFSVILLIAEEIWIGLKESISNVNKAQKNTLLSNIREHSLVPKESKYFKPFILLGVEAEKMFNDDVPILNSMKEGLSLTQIISKHVRPIKWKFRFIIWFSLAFCVPILFLFEFFLR